VADPQDRASWWQRLRQTPVTAALMAVCILVYTATLSAAISTAADPADTALHSLWSLNGHEAIFRQFGALELVRVWVDGEWWRLLTTALLHGSLLHLVLNVWSLAAIGDYVEHTWGGARTLLLFVASSLAGCLASLVWCESAMVVGASAGVLGQAGALWSARRFGAPATQTRLEEVSDFRLGILILLCLGLGAVIPGIAQAGHVGGLVMGAAIGWLWSRPRAPWQRAAGTFVGVGVLATLVALGRAPAWRPNYHLLQGLRAVDDGQLLTAAGHFRTAVELDPENVTAKNDIAYKIARTYEDLGSTLKQLRLEKDSEKAAEISARLVLARPELDWAELLARSAVSADLGNENFLDTLGWILCLQGFPEEGLSHLAQSVSLFEGEVPEEISQHVTNCPAASVLP
jgi:membrane associated rhomboid family serine protease